MNLVLQGRRQLLREGWRLGAILNIQQSLSPLMFSHLLDRSSVAHGFDPRELYCFGSPGHLEPHRGEGGVWNLLSTSAGHP